MSDYQPSNEILARYAEVLVNCGLGHGFGIKPEETVVINYNDYDPRFTAALQAAMVNAGGYFALENGMKYPADGATIEYMWSRAQHRITIKCVQTAAKKKAGESADPKLYRGLTKTELMRQFRDNLLPNGAKGWNSYTMAYYPTPYMAAEAGVTLEEFWQVIIDACYLEDEDPVGAVRNGMKRSRDVAEQLNKLDIASVHVTGEHADLTVTFVPESKFVASSGGNVPSYEVFRTPAASLTKGWIKLDLPTLYQSERIAGVVAWFEDGIATCTAEQGNEALQRLLKRKNASRLGEFALTDKRLSGIRCALPGSTMFMENIGGTGHIAFGNGYPKCFYDTTNTPDRNESAPHHDFVFSHDFIVTATLRDGSQEVIWRDGQFTFF